jgi:hypothetical protein
MAAVVDKQCIAGAAEGKLINRPLTRWHHDRKRGDTPVSQEDKAAHSAAAAAASHDGLSVKVP